MPVVAEIFIRNVQRKLKTAGLYYGEVDGAAGSKTWAAIDAAIPEPPGPASTTTDGRRILRGDGAWPFEVIVDGEDLLIRDVVITCFGGNGDGTISDPQDSGDTASGRNTKSNAIDGVSVPMDGRMFSGLSEREHRALDGSPIPRLPWFTLVELTVNGRQFRPKDGIVDLGPGKQASRRGEPHALDLTVPAAALVAADIPRNRLATHFGARGDFRILGAAKFVKDFHT